MQIKRDFDYYYNLHHVVTHSLLHLLCKVSATERHVPVTTRNDILIKFLKPKLTDKSLANVKKDIKLMLSVARRKGGNLEMKLHEPFFALGNRKHKLFVLQHIGGATWCWNRVI